LKKAIVIHQTGDSSFKDYEKLVEKKATFKNGNRYFVSKWIDADNFGVMLKKTTLVVSRAGVNTLTELALWEVPALIIPLPFVYKDEQTVNARVFTKNGLGEMLLQKDLSSTKLLTSIESMLKNIDKYKLSAKNASALVIKDAANKLVQQFYLLNDNRDKF
jgi:UDP-N-acetylglucosamine--N-acetylmuramyl-(pentapeptide) pyrophosphoryl-undecaprenol N-acetylglucosamine transferase